MDYTNTAKRALMVGMVGGMATQLYYGSQGDVQVLGMGVPSSVGVGLAAAAGSVAADVAHEWLPTTPLGDIGATGVELLAAAAATGAALDYVGVNSGFTMEGAVIGAGSLVAGRWVNGYFGGSGGLF